jgi:UTP--glucose-1-phosphate uridylyltransferase
MAQVKKAIILAAGLATRFLPYSRVVPKEFFPLGDRPLIEHLVEEAYLSGIKEVVFVLNPARRQIIDYFQEDKVLEKKLKEKKNKKALADYQRLKKFLQKISFSYVFQEIPLGDGDAILKTKNLIDKEEGVAVLFCDDIVYTEKEPALKQLMKVFQKEKSPIMALAKVKKEKLSSYGVIKGKEIKERLYQIEKFVEKPRPEEAPSNLAVVGKYIITPEVLDYLRGLKYTPLKEVCLGFAFEKMLEDKKKLFGYRLDGIWLECGTREKWLRSNLFYTKKLLQ